MKVPLAHASSTLNAPKLFLFATAALFALFGLASLAGCSSDTPNPSGSSSTALTQDERTEAIEGALSYCHSKYGIEVEPATGEGVENGFVTEGSIWGEDSFRGTPVIVSLADETFIVDVVDGEGARDDRQSMQIEEALVGYLATYLASSAETPKLLEGQLTDYPTMWSTLFDGTNIEELCAEAENMSCTLVFNEEPRGFAELPKGFSEVWCLTIADESSWAHALANERSASWAFQPECCPPYLASCLYVTQEEGNARITEVPLHDDAGFCFWDSKNWEAFFDCAHEGAGEKIQAYSEYVTFGDTYTCHADAPTFANTGTVMAFIPADQWSEIAHGYANVGYSVRQLTGATFKMGRDYANGPLIMNGNVDEFGDYYVLYVPPESKFMLYGTPTG